MTERLRPCVATLAGSRVWGDLPLSVRVYVHSYRQKDLWRWEVAASGDPQGPSPAVATNRCHKHYNTEEIRSVPGAFAFLLRYYDPKRLRTVWRRVALRDEV